MNSKVEVSYKVFIKKKRIQKISFNTPNSMKYFSKVGQIKDELSSFT